MFRPGERIELVDMPEDPDPIAPGSEGTVTDVRRVSQPGGYFWQVEVDWDNGRTLMLSVPPDRARVVRKHPRLTTID
jgi:hypothetical protein